MLLLENFKEMRLCFGQINLKRGYILNIDYLFVLGFFFWLIEWY